MARNQTSRDPKSGFCKETKTYHTLRNPATLPDPSLPLDITTFIFSLQTDTSLPTTAIIDATTGHRLSHRELHLKASTLATALQTKLNLTKGQAAFILSPTTIEIPILYLSLLSIGVIVSTANPTSTPSEISHQILLSKPQIAFSDSQNAHKIPILTLPTIIIDSSDFTDLFSRQFPARKMSIYQHDTAAILFSSGTTGIAKAVELTHRNFISLVAGIHARGGKPAVLLLTLPLFHIMGFFIFLKVVAKSETVVLVKRFEIGAMLRAVERFKVTTVAVAPPILVALSKLEVVDYDMSSLVEVRCGGAPLKKTVIDGFAAKFPGIAIGQTNSIYTGVFPPRLRQEFKKPNRSRD